MSRILFIMLATATLARSQSIETIIQKGHELAVTAVAVSPDSNYVATASRDKSAKVWNLNSGREVRSFLGHQASVIALDFSNDGKYLITGSNDQGTVNFGANGVILSSKIIKQNLHGSAYITGLNCFKNRISFSENKRKSFIL